MAQFAYRGRDGGGELQEGVLQADSAAAAARALQSRGIVPITISAVDQTGAGTPLRRFAFGGAPSLDDLMFLCRQMHTLTRAGVPLTRGMGRLAESTRNQQLADCLRGMVRSVESGHPLSQAFAQHSDLFSPVFVAILVVGESSGRLDEAFRQLAFYLERERDTRNRVRSAVRYPSMVLAAIAMAIGIINLFVIPAFAKVFTSYGAALPWATRVLLAVSNATVQYWPYGLAGSALLVLAWLRYLATEQGRLFWDRKKLRLPVVGPILLKATLGRFARSFAVMSHAGIPLIQAMGLLSGVVDNAYLGKLILGMRQGIERGDSISHTANAIGVFPPLVLQMLETGEETGNLEEMLSEIADYYESEVDIDLKNLSTAIEPILLVIVGIMVLILALGVFLPMWDLGRVALHGR
jgi:MSHA biogenesis protein MshG